MYDIYIYAYLSYCVDIQNPISHARMCINIYMCVYIRILYIYVCMHYGLGADLFWDFFSFFGGHFFFWSVGFVPAFFPAHVVWLGGVFVVVWWCFCGGVFVVVFVW